MKSLRIRAFISEFASSGGGCSTHIDNSLIGEGSKALVESLVHLVSCSLEELATSCEPLLVFCHFTYVFIPIQAC